MLVSVIMPAFNAEEYIAESIRSVLAQTYATYELIVVDDGSTDNTAQVVGSFRSSQIRYLYQSNKGLANARNTGIKASKGDLIAFLDSDDLWMEQKLALQVGAIEREEADLIYSNGYVFYDDNTEDESLVFASPEGHMRFGRIDGDKMFKFLFPVNRIPVLSVLARKRVLEQVGLFDESLRYMGHEDYDMWLRLALNRAIFYGVKEPLARYRIHPRAMSRNVVNRLLAELEVFEKHRHARELARSVRRERLRKLYKNAITALIENGMTGEARKYLLWQAWRERFSFWPVAEALLIGMLPNEHLAIYRFLRRIRASAAYRIGRPARALLSKSSVTKILKKRFSNDRPRTD